MSMTKVAIMMGSRSDLPTMEETIRVLKDFTVGYEVRILSAHRTPRETAEYAEGLKGRGVQVVVCGAGGAAALAGVVAAHTPLPVIGVPMESGLLGIDSLLSTVQMPPGVPVGSVGIGKSGAKNAGLMALRILATTDEFVGKKLDAYQQEQRRRILEQKVDF